MLNWPDIIHRWLIDFFSRLSFSLPLSYNSTKLGELVSRVSFERTRSVKFSPTFEIRICTARRAVLLRLRLVLAGSRGRCYHIAGWIGLGGRGVGHRRCSCCCCRCCCRGRRRFGCSRTQPTFGHLSQLLSSSWNFQRAAFT